MPRFVVLTHNHPTLHWDFMLEVGEVLRTWRLSAPPDVGGVIEAVPLGDHRLAYLEYEGLVSGGRGRVTRWDAGQYEMVAETSDRVEVQVAGHRLNGRAFLERGAGGWRFCWLPAADAALRTNQLG
ncbi:MAG: hypothetical protein KY476_11095 [Planctomycetes bacterium]|nr:hypothetical protein [Planctomycetota bacterium]